MNQKPGCEDLINKRRKNESSTTEIGKVGKGHTPYLPCHSTLSHRVSQQVPHYTANNLHSHLISTHWHILLSVEHVPRPLTETILASPKPFGERDSLLCIPAVTLPGVTVSLVAAPHPDSSLAHKALLIFSSWLPTTSHQRFTRLKCPVDTLLGPERAAKGPPHSVLCSLAFFSLT